MECKEHPNYQAIRKPKSTEKHPNGCPDCWKTYNAKTATDIVDIKKDTTVVQPGQTPGKTVTRVMPKAVPKVLDSIEPKPSILSRPIMTDAQAREAITEKLVDDVTKIVKGSLDEIIGKQLDASLMEVIENKKKEIAKQLSSLIKIEYEHLYVDEDLFTMPGQMISNLEQEGWKFVHFSYPLAKNGVIKKDYYLFSRVKRLDNPPIPDFSDPKVNKKYCGVK